MACIWCVSIYFASYREEGYGDKDIYVMNFLDDMELLSSLQFSIRDTLAGKPLLAHVIIKDVATGAIVVERDAENGETIANLPAGKTYEIKVVADRYLPFTEVLELPYDAGSQVVMRNIELSKDPQTRIFGTLTDITSKITLRGEIEFMDKETGEVVKGSVTDKAGRYEIILPPGHSYMLQVKSSGYALLTDSLDIPATLRAKKLLWNFNYKDLIDR
jgi:hypothetical protein